MSQRLVKLAASLQHKKYRNKEQLFIAEGEKIVADLLNSYDAKYILCDEEWAFRHKNLNAIVLDKGLIRKASSLKTPSNVIAIFDIPKTLPFNSKQKPTIVVDKIQDPGNLGTIIRTAAWFGIENLVCSLDTVDVYNPKVIQATMGALSLVNTYYKPLDTFLNTLLQNNVSIYGAFLEGKSIYETNFQEDSAIVIGNEGQGISENLKKYIENPIHIPSFSKNPPESLNASISTAIICSELMRSIQS